MCNHQTKICLIERVLNRGLGVLGDWLLGYLVAWLLGELVNWEETSIAFSIFSDFMHLY